MSNQPNACPCCGSDRVSDLGEIPWSVSSSSFAARQLDRPKVGGRLYNCTSCHLWFKWPRGEQEQINADHAAGEEFESVESISARADWQLAMTLLEQLDLPHTILDVGCFDGQFLSQLDDRWKKYGIEVHKGAATRAAARGITILGRDLAIDLPDLEERFSVVTAFDVVEHTLDPLQFLRAMSQALVPGGQLIVSTGNTSAPSWRFMQSRYWYCTLPAHVSFINPAWCNFAAGRVGLDVVRILRYSHVPVHSIVLEVRDWAKNIVYKYAPAIAASLRQRGFGRLDVHTHPELENSPPCFGYARDHILVAFRKKVKAVV